MRSKEVLRLALLTTDGRYMTRDYAAPEPAFGTAPKALIQGFTNLPEIEVHVVSCTQKAMQSPVKLADNIWFHSLHVPKTGWLRTGYQGCIRAVRKKLKEIQPDIVHGQGTERDCAISAVFSGFPSVVTIHGNMAELARLFRARIGSYDWLTARLENLTLRRTKGVFCNSAYTESLVRPRTKRTWRVPNPLRQEFFSPRDNATTRLPPCIWLNVGVVSKRKRQLELLDIVQALRRQGLEFAFHFIGQANPTHAYAAAFLRRIKPLEAEGCARYLGTLSTEKLIATMDTASALIHVPTEEAFGLVVAEALARNLKFFGTDTGGIVDVASGIEGAELFQKDDWPGLENSIARWMKIGCPRPAAAANAMHKRYHPAIIARRHAEIYREVLQQPV